MSLGANPLITICFPLFVVFEVILDAQSQLSVDIFDFYVFGTQINNCLLISNDLRRWWGGLH